MDNLFQFLDKILPLISTLLGAYITYFVTVSSKKSELKVNAQTKARDEYWIACFIFILYCVMLFLRSRPRAKSPFYL